MNTLVVFKRSVESGGSLNIIAKAVTTIETIDYDNNSLRNYLMCNNIEIIRLNLKPFIENSLIKNSLENGLIETINQVKNILEELWEKEEYLYKNEEGNIKFISIFIFIIEYIINKKNSLLFKIFNKKDSIRAKDKKTKSKEYILIFNNMDWKFIAFIFSIVNITLSGGNNKYRHKTSILDKKLIDFLNIITQGDNKKIEHILINNVINLENIDLYYTNSDLIFYDEEKQLRKEYREKGEIDQLIDDFDQTKDGVEYRGKLLKKGTEVIDERIKEKKNFLKIMGVTWKYFYEKTTFDLNLKALKQINDKLSNKNILNELNKYDTELKKLEKISIKIEDKNRLKKVEENRLKKLIEKIRSDISFNDEKKKTYEHLTSECDKLLNEIYIEIEKIIKDDNDINDKEFILIILIIIYIILEIKKISFNKNLLLQGKPDKKILDNKEISRNIKKNNKLLIKRVKKLKKLTARIPARSDVFKGERSGERRGERSGKNKKISNGNILLSLNKTNIKNNSSVEIAGKDIGKRRFGSWSLIDKSIHQQRKRILLKLENPPPIYLKKYSFSFTATHQNEQDDNTLENTLEIYNNLKNNGGVEIYREKKSVTPKISLKNSELEDDDKVDDDEDNKFSLLNSISNLINNKLILDKDDDEKSLDITVDNDIEAITYENSFNNQRNYTRKNVQTAIEEYWIENIKKNLFLITDKENNEVPDIKQKINLKKNLSKILKESSETIKLLKEKKKFKKYLNIFVDLEDIDYLIIALTLLITHHQKKTCTDIDNLIGKSISFNSYYNNFKLKRKEGYKKIKKLPLDIYEQEKNIFKNNRFYIGEGIYNKNYKEFIKENNLTSEDFKILGHLYIISLELSQIINKIYIDTKAYIRFNDKYYKIFLNNLITSPTQLPMMCPPNPYGENQYGGFLLNNYNMNSLITGSIDYEKHEITEKLNLYSAINKVNSIKFEINNDLLNYINNQGQYLIENVKNNEMSELQVKYTLAIAEAYKNRYFYLPVNADWRGRMYVQSFFITYQGNDLSSSLVQFSKGCKLDETGLDFFYIYGANLYNESNINKSSFKDRKEWTLNNLANIIKMEKDWIEKADQKLKFVAFCLAYKKYSEKNGDYEVKLPMFLDATCNGLQHLAALILDYDLGSRVNLVKQKVTDKVSDIYKEVLDPINKKINDSINSIENKDKILYNPNLLELKNLKLNRKIIKPLIMTKPYNATIEGMSRQLMDSVKETKHTLVDCSKNFKLKSTYYVFPGHNGQVILNKNSIYFIANIIHKEIFIIFPELKKVFDFLIKMAEICVKAEIPLYWFTPHGVKINQHYIKHYTKNISFKLGKRSETVVIATEYKKGDKVVTNILKQKQAIIPNVIHSLDAAHLAFIINNNNIDIIGIHDCFGTLPNNLLTLEQSVRKEFINIYSKDNFLKTFHDRILQSLQDHGINVYKKTINNITQSQIKVKYYKKNDGEKNSEGYKTINKKNKTITLVIPDPPKMGDLDLTEIIHSKYMVN